ncbi:hypothetical protein ABZ383_27005 [Streptomyces sp. NPDC005900]
MTSTSESFLLAGPKGEPWHMWLAAAAAIFFIALLTAYVRRDRRRHGK